MKTLLDKLKNNFKEKGFKKTASLVFGFLKNGLTSEQHRIKLLGKYVREHNQAYGKISQLAMELKHSCADHETKALAVQKWYLADKGLSMQQEINTLLLKTAPIKV